MKVLRITCPRLRLAAFPLAFLLTGCARAPESLAMPPQYAMPSGAEPAVTSLPNARPMLSMSDADIDAHILRDVMPAASGEPARWTNAQPAFRIVLNEVDGLEFYIHFFLPEPTFQVTGPVRLAVTINGAAVATPEFRSEGDHEFQCAIPAGLLKSGRPATVSLEVRPPYRSPQDGSKLGILLFAIGFRKSGA